MINGKNNAIESAFGISWIFFSTVDLFFIFIGFLMGNVGVIVESCIFVATAAYILAIIKSVCVRECGGVKHE